SSQGLGGGNLRLFLAHAGEPPLDEVDGQRAAVVRDDAPAAVEEERLVDVARAVRRGDAAVVVEQRGIAAAGLRARRGGALSFRADDDHEARAGAEATDGLVEHS